MENFKDLYIEKEYTDKEVVCYKVKGAELLNQYYIVSEPATRKLMNSPEVVSFDVYKAMVPATTCALKHINETGAISKANILSILRGALNYPLEESLYNVGIEVHDISFLSSERVFDENGVPNGLVIKYNKMAMIPDSTLLIGDIIASGATLMQCMRYVTEHYRNNDAALKNIIIFTIGGTKALDMLETMTREIREYWPEFEGFITVFYEGIFSCYDDNGVSGINIPDIDFIWRGGIVSPEFRRQTLSMKDPLFEKCIIYDGGARRYEISEHIEEVLAFWEGLLERADDIDFDELLAEKLGHSLDIGYADWLMDCHYTCIPDHEAHFMYAQEKGYIAGLKDTTLEEIATRRIGEFREALKDYMR